MLAPAAVKALNPKPAQPGVHPQQPHRRCGIAQQHRTTKQRSCSWAIQHEHAPACEGRGGEECVCEPRCQASSSLHAEPRGAFVTHPARAWLPSAVPPRGISSAAFGAAKYRLCDITCPRLYCCSPRGEKTQQQDWFWKGLQGGRAHPLAACGAATLWCSPPALKPYYLPRRSLRPMVSSCSVADTSGRSRSSHTSAK
jgi:hypothetical protein